MKNFVFMLFVMICGVVFFSNSCRAVTVAEAMGFEVTNDVWVTEADLSQFTLSDLWCEHVESGSYTLLRRGGARTTAYIKQGQYALKWDRHNEFPTLSTTYVNTDWSGFSTVSFWVYSEVATGETIYFAVCSDNASTAWKDFYYTSFVVNWNGWQQVTVSLSSFSQYESPDGWDNVSKVVFYTKAFAKQPNPYTVLYLDDMNCQ